MSLHEIWPLAQKCPLHAKWTLKEACPLNKLAPSNMLAYWVPGSFFSFQKIEKFVKYNSGKCWPQEAGREGFPDILPDAFWRALRMALRRSLRRALWMALWRAFWRALWRRSVALLVEKSLPLESQLFKSNFLKLW